MKTKNIERAIVAVLTGVGLMVLGGAVQAFGVDSFEPLLLAAILPGLAVLLVPGGAEPHRMDLGFVRRHFETDTSYPLSSVVRKTIAKEDDMRAALMVLGRPPHGVVRPVLEGLSRENALRAVESVRDFYNMWHHTLTDQYIPEQPVVPEQVRGHDRKSRGEDDDAEPPARHLKLVKNFLRTA